MMRTTAVILLVCLAANGLAQEAATDKCTTGLYGENCNNVCIGCKDNAGCDKTTGECANGCAEGYKVSSKTKQCEATCFGVQGNAGCENDGECVAPNYRWVFVLVLSK